MSRTAQVVLLSAVAFLVGVTWCGKGGDGDHKAERDAALLGDSIARLERRDSVRRADSAETAARLREYEATARRLAIANARQTRRADSLARLVPPEDTTARLALDAKDSVIATVTGERDAALALLTLTARALGVADSLSRAWRGVALGAQVQLGAALKRTRKRWGCVGGGGASGGYGFGAGLSFTCGRVL